MQFFNLVTLRANVAAQDVSAIGTSGIVIGVVIDPDTGIDFSQYHSRRRALTVRQYSVITAFETESVQQYSTVTLS